MQPRYYQSEAVQSVFDYFTKGNKGNPIIALPTGTGKSVVISLMIKKIFEAWPNQKILNLTHVKELIDQNAKKLIQVWPLAPAGIYSAGLGKKEVYLPIIFGGVGSVVNNYKSFGHVDLITIDECHLLSPRQGSSYQKIINGLKEINPYLKVIGLSATPYRMGSGLLTEGDIFTDICYDLTSYKKFNRLVSEGFLSPLITKRTAFQYDVSDVSIHKGEFSQTQLDKAVNTETATIKALKEICEYGFDRKAWLIFATSIDHACNIAQTLQSFGIEAAAVHSKMKPKERDSIIEAFKKGELRCIVNKDILTTGFDCPHLDLLGILRPTTSPGLWVQMLGRGTRPSPDTQKENCLVLDFAGNTIRLGPINDPVIPKRKGKKGDAPIKLCEGCGSYNHASVRICSVCLKPFDIQESAPKIKATATKQEVMKSDLPIIESFDVQKAIFCLHQKTGSPPMIKAAYYCGLRVFYDYICFEHKGFASKKAREWWRLNIKSKKHYLGIASKDYAPATTKEALQRISELATPAKIKVHVNKKYPEIKEYIYI